MTEVAVSARVHDAGYRSAELQQGEAGSVHSLCG